MIPVLDPSNAVPVYINERLLHLGYWKLELHTRLYIKGMIEQRVYRAGIPHRCATLLRDLDTLQLVAALSSYRNAVNHFIVKYILDTVDA